MYIHLKLLEELTNSIFSETEGSIPQCHYIVGERGYGKTSLLHSLERNISADDRIRVVYLNCLLKSELKVDDFLDAGTANIRIVYLLDDFDSFLSASSEEDLYKLRGLVYSENGPIIVGTGKNITNQFTEYSAPLYDSFMLHVLKELDVNTGRKLVAEIRGLSDLPTEDMFREIFSIIGCTPETCSLLALVKHYGQEVSEIITESLNHYGAYFKSILNSLTLSQRDILISLLDYPGPMLLKEIRMTTEMSSQEIMPILIMLNRKGLVDTIKHSSRKTEYGIHDKLLRAWYWYCAKK